MRTLPVLEARRAELETCVFCPKLCRSACPVSNAEPRETITPWGKMSLSWMAAHGDVPMDRPHAAPAWACTGCLACREWCDHRNPVASVLVDARSALTRQGVAPEGAVRVLRGFARHLDKTRRAARKLQSHPRVNREAPVALFVGCGYLRAARPETVDAIDAAYTLLGQSVALVDQCCGLPLRLAGDREAFTDQARGVAAALKTHTRIIVVDAGCALALQSLYREDEIALRPKVELLVQLAARSRSVLSPVLSRAEVRWHDPCQLGRGLGVYDAPRAVLAHLLGHAPAEFDQSRDQAVCSGAGGLLPATMPAVARQIADARLEAHAGAGGGRIVTACASSLLALRKRARGTGVAVDDLVTWIARGARGDHKPWS
jgi:Fe-S oxidoreductase